MILQIRMSQGCQKQCMVKMYGQMRKEVYKFKHSGSICDAQSDI